jgi:hypothetical protein
MFVVNSLSKSKANQNQTILNLFSRKRHDYAQYGRFDHPFDAFHEFFGGGEPGPGGGFRFKFQSSGGEGGGGGQRIYHKQSITSKAYWNTILPNR